MKKIGIAIAEIRKFLIVKSVGHSRKFLGKTVYDKNGAVGRIVDIIGPVRSPYLKILKKRDSKVDDYVYVRG